MPRMSGAPGEEAGGPVFRSKKGLVVTVPWRVAMGTLALAVTLGGFLVAPMLPGGGPPA